ncbi:MAG TPA: DoxX family membrane protein [Candidatus Paceibacterota bacterium]
MLSLFPQILYLAPLGITLLRIAAGLTFLSLAYFHVMRSRELSTIRFPVVGSGAWIVWLAIIFETLIGVALVLGIYAQLAALLGAVAAIKLLIWRKRYPQFFTLTRHTSALLLVICLCLVVSGAGAYAFDLPL